MRSSRVETLVPADLAALKAQIYVDSLTPNIRDSQELRYHNIVASAAIQGVGAAYFRVKDITMEAGQALLDRDIAGLAQVAVIDQNTKKKLFHLPGRGRHRGNEHHAGLGDRAHP